jgi:hypothetical protein
MGLNRASRRVEPICHAEAVQAGDVQCAANDPFAEAQSITGSKLSGSTDGATGESTE